MAKVPPSQWDKAQTILITQTGKTSRRRKHFANTYTHV